jgi:hypothetical protein
MHLLIPGISFFTGISSKLIAGSFCSGRGHLVCFEAVQLSGLEDIPVKKLIFTGISSNPLS